MKETHPKFKLWLSTDTVSGAFGDGKWKLLKAVRGTGSLSRAAAELDISYRKAWGDLRKAEGAMGATLVTRKRGGKDGGAMKLTPVGEKLLANYTSFRRAVDSAVKREFDKHMGNL